MNEKQYALKIKEQLTQATNDLNTIDNFIACECSRTLEELKNNKINEIKIIKICKELNISAQYANLLNDKYWQKEWKKQPCIVFTIQQ